jgi:methylphosphotriester-DNA--protein-cysteine methyltransferase
MRPFLTIALALFTFGLVAQAPTADAFVGNKEAMVYHLPTCKLVLKIKPENKVPLTTKDQAGKAGYAPCKICLR